MQNERKDTLGYLSSGFFSHLTIWNKAREILLSFEVKIRKDGTWEFFPPERGKNPNNFNGTVPIWGKKSKMAILHWITWYSSSLVLNQKEGQRSQITGHRSQITDQRSQMTYDRSQTDLRPQVSDLRSQISNSRSQIKDSRSQISDPRSQIPDLRSHIPDLRSQIIYLRSQMTDLRWQI